MDEDILDRLEIGDKVLCKEDGKIYKITGKNVTHAFGKFAFSINNNRFVSKNKFFEFYEIVEKKYKKVEKESEEIDYKKAGKNLAIFLKSFLEEFDKK